MKYDVFLKYLIVELESATGREILLHDEALIECLVKHRELTSGPRLWSPLLRSYQVFNASKHGSFSCLSQKDPCGVKYTLKLLPLYCRLCFLSDCHERAESVAKRVLSRLEQAVRHSPTASLPYEIRAASYLAYNLSASPPREWSDVARTPDVSVDAKVAVELLWSHLVLVYSGNRKLLLYNVEQFFIRQQKSLTLCPIELRAALFAHGRHDPVSKRNDRCRKGHSLSRRSTACPVESTRHPRRSRGKRQTADNRLYESRIARLCWLGALWTLDFECNKAIFHWLHKAEPYRG